MDLVSWSFEADNAALVGGLGFWIGFIGLVLSVGGFWITIYQVRKTRSAADAAKAEAARIEASFNRYSVINDAARASAALSTARDFLRIGLWEQVSNYYEIVRGGLLALKVEASGLSEDQVTKINDACNFIQRLCERIERELHTGEVKRIDPAKTVSVMTEHKLLIADITRHLEKGAIQ